MGIFNSILCNGSARFLNTINGNITSADQVNHTLTVTLKDGTGSVVAYPYDGSDNVSISVSESSHYHGDISSTGAITNTDVTIASGDKLIVMDSSNSNKIAKTSVSFDGSTTTQCLTKKGTWATFGTSNLTIGTTATTAAAGNHTHGNIQNGGTLQTNDITIGSGDKLVVTDSSDSNKIARTSASFSAAVSSQTQSTKFLREDGTFAAPSYTTNTDTKVTQTPFGTVSSNATYELLFSGSADNTEHTETTKKSSYATFDPYEKAFTFGTRSTGGVGSSSFAEGSSVIASGNYSHAEGYNTTASNTSCHVEGANTTASEANSHAEGYHTTASGNSSHAEGYYTTASGNSSHAEGYYTTASGDKSHAEGYYTTATHRSQHVFGEYSVADDSTADATDRGNYIEIVGNGTSGTARSNARTLDWNGNEWLAGSLSIASLSGSTASIISNSFCQIVNKTQTSMVGMGMDTSTYAPSFMIFADNKNLTATNSDITLAGTSNTWDGTNTSLKTAITTVADRNWYTYVEFSNKNNVAANTVTNLGTWKPTVGGVYLIQYVARFSANASGYRKIYIASSATTSDGVDRFARVSVQACNGDHTYIELVAIETLIANTTYYFNAIHNASAAVNISYPGLKIMRIR